MNKKGKTNVYLFHTNPVVNFERFNPKMYSL